MFNTSFTNRKRKVTCKVCGKIFYSANPSTKTCSIECSMDNKAAQKERAKKNSRRYRSQRNAKV